MQSSRPTCRIHLMMPLVARVAWFAFDSLCSFDVSQSERVVNRSVDSGFGTRSHWRVPGRGRDSPVAVSRWSRYRFEAGVDRPVSAYHLLQLSIVASTIQHAAIICWRLRCIFSTSKVDHILMYRIELNKVISIGGYAPIHFLTVCSDYKCRETC